MPPQPKQRLAAEAEFSDRLTSSLAALVGKDWREKRYGVAVSGGGDSMALLAMMARLLPGRVSAATVDHGLRDGSADEAAMVAGWCAKYGVPHNILRPAKRITGSLQAAAREARYALLEDWRSETRLDFVATAHHADDQLETMIMRLNRSSGVSGLAGVRGRQRHILRPLLHWRRNELEQWLAANAVPYISDPSNSDPRFDRARLRKMLANQTLMDPKSAARSAEWLDQADQALEWMVSELIATWPDASDRAVIRDYRYPDELLRRIIARRLRTLDPGLGLRGVALDGVMKAMRGRRRAMVGQLLIDPQPHDGSSVWRISAAPRRKTREK